MLTAISKTIMKLKKCCGGIKSFIPGFLCLILILLISASLFLLQNIKSQKNKIEAEDKTTKKTIFINALSKSSVDDDLDLELSLRNQSGQPIKNAFVSVYSADGGNQIYGYSILRTNSEGKVNLSLQKGKYDFVISSEGKNNNEDFFYLSQDFNFSSPSEQKKSVDLNLFKMELLNFPGDPPAMKVEITKKTSYGYLPSQMLAFKPSGENAVRFYVSGGTYNINLDTEFFNSTKTETYALVQKNVEIPRDGRIVFNYDKLTKFYVNIDGIKYAWFKLQTNDSGDFQGMFFGDPVTVYSNSSNLWISSVYIPSQDCIDFVKKKAESESSYPDKEYYAMNVCTDSDIRYDILDLNLKPDEIVTVFPPGELTLISNANKIKQGDQLDIKFQLKTKGVNQISSISVHQFWDTKILPKFNVLAKDGKVVYSTDLFDDNFTQYNSNRLLRTTCLKPGEYIIKAEIPTGTWGQKNLKSSVGILVTGGVDCADNETDAAAISDRKFSSWQELFSRREELWKKSTGYTMSLPAIHANPSTRLDLSKTYTVKSCDDINKISDDAESVSVVIGEKAAYDSVFQSEFSDCLRDFAGNYPLHKSLILINDFFDFNKHAFPNVKMYIFYHYYLVLRQQSNSAIGIMADSFMDLFYGFPDFVVMEKNDLNGYPVPENEVISETNKWITNYRDIITTPIIYSD